MKDDTVRRRRYGPMCLAVVALWAGFAAASAAGRAALGDDYQPGTPLTYLFDTGSRSPGPLSARAIAGRTGWAVLAEDDLKHPLAGDAVLRNDRLTVVLRRDGPGVEVHLQGTDGPKQRATLVPLPTGARSAKGISALKILENNRGAVMIEATFKTDTGQDASVGIRLAAGQQIVEIRPAQRADRLVVWDRPDYLVVPDFFADDMVFGRNAFGRWRHGLPTENLVLHLLDGGNALVMCVWKSSRQSADAIMIETAGRRRLGGCELRCARDEPIWIAVLEGPGLWHESRLRPAAAPREVALDWKPPFLAGWRADLLREDGMARSCLFGADGQPAGPCRLDGGRVVIRVPAAEAPANGEPPSLPVVVYPLDRTRETPLAVFTPTDVVRNTLGVGPCQYILQTEGLLSESSPTPAQVMDWVQKQFERKKHRDSAEQIEELLKQMVGHVGHVEARTRRYAEFAGEVHEICAAAPQQGHDSQAAAELGAIAQELEQIASASWGQKKPAQAAAELADAVVELIGRDNLGQDSALAECRQLGASLREIGAFQDRTLSKSRMLVRWLRQKARMQALEASGRAELATKVLARAERILHEK